MSIRSLFRIKKHDKLMSLSCFLFIISYQQILAMVSEQERNESKRRQAQGIQVAKEKGVYKGRPLLYSANAKDPKKRIIYHRVVEMLKEGQAISKIAKEVNITRQTVYRIKHDKGLS